MKWMTWLSVLSMSCGALALVGCADEEEAPPQDHDGDHDHDDDHDHDHDHDHDAELPPSCEAFHEACILAEDGSAAAKACHDFVHQKDLDEAQCAAKKPECEAACVPNASSSSGGSSSGASEEPGACLAAGKHCAQNTECCSGECHVDHCH